MTQIFEIIFICFLSVPAGLEDVSKYPELFASLLASGMWTIEDLKKLAGLNFIRVFKEVERVKLIFIVKLLSKVFSQSGPLGLLFCSECLSDPEYSSWYHSLYLSISDSLCLFVSLSLCLSASLSLCLSVCLCLCLCLCVSISVYISLSLCLSVFLFISNTVNTSIKNSSISNKLNCPKPRDLPEGDNHK